MFGLPRAAAADGLQYSDDSGVSLYWIAMWSGDSQVAQSWWKLQSGSNLHSPLFHDTQMCLRVSG